MSFFSKLLWYKHRLAAMSPPEIRHRVKEAAKKFTGRFLTPPSPSDFGLLPHFPGVRDALRRWTVPETLLQEWQKDWRMALKGQFGFLGMKWPACSAKDKWHLDPVTSESWPSASYCFAIDFRHESKKGDIKYVWELGRLQYLCPIAAFAFFSNDPQAGRFALSEIESWIDHNPPYVGIHWASGIELALRAVSILIVTTFAGEHATQAQRLKIWGTLHAHAVWLERYPSRFSSANNHLAAEGLGLFAIGALCPNIKGADHFRKSGWETLVACSQTLILADGAGAEQALAYAGFTAEILLLGMRIAHGCEMDVPSSYTQRLVLAGEYLRWFTDTGSNQPKIGDDDEGRVIGGGENTSYISSILASIAAVTQRADLSPPFDEPHLRQVFFGFPPQATEAPRGVRTFSDGGYTVYRDDKTLLALDHGMLGYLSIAAHGHADTLGIWLHRKSQPILVDAGTYLYHSGGNWRRYFRGTKAHNTLLLQDTDASLMSGHFNWSHKASGRLLSVREERGCWQIDTEHDGYLGRLGALHCRTLDIRTDGFTTTDSITGTNTFKADVGFLLHPCLRAFYGEGAIQIFKADRHLLSIVHVGPLTPYIRDGASDDCGWYSPSFGIKQPTTRIVFTGMLAPGQKAVTGFTYG